MDLYPEYNEQEKKDYLITIAEAREKLKAERDDILAREDQSHNPYGTALVDTALKRCDILQDAGVHQIDSHAGNIKTGVDDALDRLHTEQREQESERKDVADRAAEKEAALDKIKDAVATRAKEHEQDLRDHKTIISMDVKTFAEWSVAKPDKQAELLRAQEKRNAGDFQLDADRKPLRSEADWTKHYDVQERKDGALVYSRDGEAKIVDRGSTLEVADDRASIRDAVTLCKEQGSLEVNVLSKEPEKRAEIIRELCRQELKVAGMLDNPVLFKEYGKAAREVQHEIAEEAALKRQLDVEKTNETETDAGEIEPEKEIGD